MKSVTNCNLEPHKLGWELEEEAEDDGAGADRRTA